MAVRVLICNGISLYAEGLRRLLGEDSGVLVVGVVCEDHELDQLERLDADVVIADASWFSKLAGRARKILLIWDGRIRQSFPALGELRGMAGQGLVGILDARTNPVLLRKAVAKVHAGEIWIRRELICTSLFGADTSPKVHLTQREAEILQHICSGQSNREIGEQLCISEQTVKTHCNRLFKKFNVSSRLQLAIRVSSGD